jgi:putative sigma-54 modulation protein
MKLQVTGKNLDVTAPIVDYAERKLTKLAKHLSDSSRVELELAVERNPSISDNQIAEATVWTKGPILRAKESSHDMKASIDQIVDKLERQVTRYREKRQRKGSRRDGIAAPEQTPGVPVEGDGMIVKTKQFPVKPMTPEEAVLQLELVGHDFFVFRNAESDEVNVVYRRRDGAYGLIEPQ